MLVSKEKKVVYWIGAGASAKALPIVSDMLDALRASFQWLRNGFYDGLLPLDIERYSNTMESLASKALAFGTIDTYARSLFLLREWEKLAELKIHLGLFFILEQAMEARPYKGRQYASTNYERSERIDTRYMGWLALLLDSNLKLPDNVRVVSWNYDLQVEHAVGLYMNERDLSQLHGRHNLSYPGIESDESYMNRRPFVVHLNGVAGLVKNDRGRFCLHGSLNAGDAQNYIRHIFTTYKDYDRREAWLMNAMNETFTFAWEGTSTAKTGVALAKSYLQEADIVVIVGYSFPSFNRSIDKELVDVMRTSSTTHKPKYVVVQNPTMTEHGFRTLFRWANADGFPGVVHVADTSSFHLPPELFLIDLSAPGYGATCTTW